MMPDDESQDQDDDVAQVAQQNVAPKKECSQLLLLLQNLERLLSLQAQEITRKNIEAVVHLSEECADICQQLKPILTPSLTPSLTTPYQNKITNNDSIQAVEIDRLIRSCQALQQGNSHSLARLTSYCNAFIELLRGPPLSYGKNATVTYPSSGKTLCKL
ncbi:hypothetical protein [Endozoicomonas sp. SESOKO1]|uniref:hypothetical protein n=1 Tax=Endozoicomonas sp. SESOKO1 TaxID=2828742 RepID=UPI002148F189|nr:hypothetical protein [Endozoicomonas sp. SESOKO1]